IRNPKSEKTRISDSLFLPDSKIQIRLTTHRVHRIPTRGRDDNSGAGLGVGAGIVMVQRNAEPGADQRQLGRIDFPYLASELHGASEAQSGRRNSGGSTAGMQ